MKHLSESNALVRLEKIKNSYRAEIQEKYEPKAKSCLTCETQGACCIDEHFVNVHITRLEALVIRHKLKEFEKERQREIYIRIENTIRKYSLKQTGDTFSQTFACPLFEKGIGCTIHSVKPVPCIQHACYERAEDLPPDELQTETEAKIERLNEQVYHQSSPWLPLPIWLNILEKSGK